MKFCDLAKISPTSVGDLLEDIYFDNKELFNTLGIQAHKIGTQNGWFILEDNTMLSYIEEGSDDNGYHWEHNQTKFVLTNNVNYYVEFTKGL